MEPIEKNMHLDEEEEDVDLDEEQKLNLESNFDMFF